MPDVPPARDEVSALRASGARLRAVVEAKDTEIAALRAALEAGRLPRARQGELIRDLELRVAELERRLRMDSANSSVPPSKEHISAKARRKAALRESQRERSKQRRPGGRRDMGARAWSRRASRTGPSGLIPRRSAGPAGRAWPAPGRRAWAGRRSGMSRR